MADFLVTAFSSAEVRGVKLIGLYDSILSGCLERSDDLCAFDERGAYFDAFTVADKKHFVYHERFGIRGYFRQLDIERVALADLILFTALFDYRIHSGHSSVRPPNIPLKGRYYSVGAVAVKANLVYFFKNPLPQGWGLIKGVLNADSDVE